MESLNERSRLLKDDDIEEVTTAKDEAKWLTKSALPITATYTLQLITTTVAIYISGRLGTTELSATSLCIVIVAVCGYGIFQGMATAIDTLGSHAFGRSDYEGVGLVSIKCTALMLFTGAIIGCIWLNSTYYLPYVSPDDAVLELAAAQLKSMVWDIPPYIITEGFKHYFQVQGLFHIATAVMAISVPLNIAMSTWLVLGSANYGALGVPWAIVFTDSINVLLCTVFALVFTDGKCIPRRLSWASLRDLRPVAKLAASGAVLFEAEWLAFEIVTLSSSRLGTTVMAAQSIIGNICTINFQIPLAFGLAASTRVGNLLGARRKRSVKIAAQTALYASALIACFNLTTIFSMRHALGNFFSNDKEVVELVAATLPFAAVFQLCDSLNAVTGGILRGHGWQLVCSAISLAFYYGMAMPISFTLAFKFEYGLTGLWIGLVSGLAALAVFQLGLVIAVNK